MKYEFTEAFAKEQDKADELSHFRNSFHIPKIDGKEVHYFTGNSLGLQPKLVKEIMLEELDSWAEHGVEGQCRHACLGKVPHFCNLQHQGEGNGKQDIVG